MEFANVLVQMPGGFPGVNPPGMTADKCITPGSYLGQHADPSGFRQTAQETSAVGLRSHMHAEKTLGPLEAVRGRPKEFGRASGGLFSPRSDNVNFNKDKQTQTKTAPLGATNSLKVNVNDQQMSFSSHLLGAKSSRDWGRIVQWLDLWGELADIRLR